VNALGQLGRGRFLLASMPVKFSGGAFADRSIDNLVATRPHKSRLHSRSLRSCASGDAGKGVGEARGDSILQVSQAERGSHVSALFYSLIESAKLCGVEPHADLREATLRAVRNPGPPRSCATSNQRNAERESAIDSLAAKM
jgi:hypothetical protein